MVLGGFGVLGVVGMWGWFFGVFCVGGWGGFVGFCLRGCVFVMVSVGYGVIFVFLVFLVWGSWGTFGYCECWRVDIIYWWTIAGSTPYFGLCWSGLF